MTRPIPWRALFASKIILLGTTFVAVPALCEVVLMLACRVPIAEIALVALQTILFQALWLLFVMALSATTRDLARFALVAGGVLVGLVLLVSTSLAVMLRSMPDGPQLSVVTGRAVSGPAAGVVMLLLLIVAAVVPLVVQYRTRSVRTSVAAGVAGISVAVLIGMMWPSHEEPLPVPVWARQESAVRMVAESQKGEFRLLESPWNRPESWQLGSVRLGLSGIEPGWLATVMLVDASVQFDDGTTLATAGNGYQSPLSFESVADSPVKVVMRHVLGVERVWERSQDHVRPAVDAIAVSQADFKRYLGQERHVSRAFPREPRPRRNRGDASTPRRRRISGSATPHRRRSSHPASPGRLFTGAPVHNGNHLPFEYSSSTVVLSSQPRCSRSRRRLCERGDSEMSAGVGLAMLFGVSSHSSEPANGFDVTSDLIRFPEGYGSDDRGRHQPGVAVARGTGHRANDSRRFGSENR